MKKIFKDAADALENMSGNELADMLERIIPNQHNELEGEERENVLLRIKDIEPVDMSASLHVFEEMYIIDGQSYSVCYYGKNEPPSVFHIVPNDFSKLRESDPKQLSLF